MALVAGRHPGLEVQQGEVPEVQVGDFWKFVYRVSGAPSFPRDGSRCLCGWICIVLVSILVIVRPDPFNLTLLSAAS